MLRVCYVDHHFPISQEVLLASGRGRRAEGSSRYRTVHRVGERAPETNVEEMRFVIQDKLKNREMIRSRIFGIYALAPAQACTFSADMITDTVNPQQFERIPCKPSQLY